MFGSEKAQAHRGMLLAPCPERSPLLRKIDRFVDLSEVRAHLEPYYSDVGRPSIDPELMMRMLIVGYCFGIRSERRLMRRGPPQPGLPLVSLGGHGLSTPLFSAGQVGSARKGSGFLACSTPGGVGGQDGLRRVGRPSSATRPADKCRTVATSDAGSSDPRSFRALLSAWSAELGFLLVCVPS